MLGVLSLYPFEIKDGPNGTSLTMYPLVGFASQAQGYVIKGRRFLSDAPLGRFFDSLARCLPLQAAHAFGAYCRSTLSELGKVWAGFLLAGAFGAGLWPSGLDLGARRLINTAPQKANQNSRARNMNQTRTNQTHKTRQNKRKQTSEASNQRYETNAPKQNKQANNDEKTLREKPLRAWWGTYL